MVLAHLTNPLLGNRINNMQTASPELELDPLSLPDARGHFGAYGGMYVPETLMTPLFELTEAYHEARKDPANFKKSSITSSASLQVARPTFISRID